MSFVTDLFRKSDGSKAQGPKKTHRHAIDEERIQYH